MQSSNKCATGIKSPVADDYIPSLVVSASSSFLQCFDIAGWVTESASGHKDLSTYPQSFSPGTSQGSKMENWLIQLTWKIAIKMAAVTQQITHLSFIHWLVLWNGGTFTTGNNVQKHPNFESENKSKYLALPPKCSFLCPQLSPRSLPCPSDRPSKTFVTNVTYMKLTSM